MDEIDEQREDEHEHEHEQDQQGESRAVVPFRHRHDGWTPKRQQRFLERLQGTGSVKEACRAAGLSTTSAYRAYARMPEFAMMWSRALDARRPMLEDAAFERAVKGLRVPLTRLGKVVGMRRHFSDSLLRFLIEREDRREGHAAGAKSAGNKDKAAPIVLPTREETTEAILKKLEVVEKRFATKARAQQLEWCERMEKAGLAP